MACRIIGHVSDAVTGNLITSGSAHGSGPTTFDASIYGGEFDSGPIEQGYYSVTVSSSGYQAHTETVNLLDGQQFPLYFDLEPAAPPPPLTGSITGRVTEAETGNAIPVCTVTIDSRTFYTDINGYYDSGDLTAAFYYVSAYKSGYNASSQNVNLPAGQRTTINFALTKVGPPPIPTCPSGQHWDGTKCVPDIIIHECPTGQHWDAAQNKCVQDVVPTTLLDVEGWIRLFVSLLVNPIGAIGTTIAVGIVEGVKLLLGDEVWKSISTAMTAISDLATGKAIDEFYAAHPDWERKEIG